MLLVIFIAAFILISAAGLMLMPFILYIDTRVLIVKFRWKGIGDAMLTYREEKWILMFRLLFYKKEIELSELKSGTKRKKKKKTRRKKIDVKKLVRKITHVVKSFRAPVCRLSLDTGNYVYNAWLYPVNHLMGGGCFNINFYDENYLELELRNNLWRMVYAWFR